MSHKVEICCFTLRNFDKTGGGSIRISGILNALAKKGVRINLYTLFSEVGYLDNSINLIQLPNELGNFNKRKFQFLLSILPVPFVNKLFSTELQYLTTSIKKEHRNKPFIFFEYLDNSIAYWLKTNDVVDGYINDIHGIVPLEFQENAGKSIVQKVLFKFKELSALKLDKKTINEANAIIYPSVGVKDFFEEKVYSQKTPKSIIVNEAINELLLKQQRDRDICEKLYHEEVLLRDHKTIMFIGDFKPFGGVEDLFDAFILFKKRNPSSKVRLILIGDGQLYNKLHQRIEEEQHSNIILLGRIPYQKLASYQSCADVLVCPDRDTTYSQLLPHIKYFDSISSGKIVIQGNFSFSNSLNPDQFFSIDFEPSNIGSLTTSIELVLNNFEELSKKAKKSSLVAREKFRYQHSVEPLFNYLMK